MSNPDKKTALLAGGLYTVLLFGSGFSEITRTTLISDQNAVATAASILANEALFKASFISDLIGQTAFLLLGITLYKLLSPVSKSHAVVMLAFVAVSVPMAMLNLLNQFAAIQLLSGVDYLKVMGSDQLIAQAMFFLELREYGVFITGIFWGLWLFPFGYLVYSSGYFPKAIGILLMGGCFGYLIDFFVQFLLPSYPVITYPGLAIATVAELSAIAMLLVHGLRKTKVTSNLQPVHS